MPVRAVPKNTIGDLASYLIFQEQRFIDAGAVRIAGPTNQYNCHSYAWYLQSTGNTYFMDDPRAFWNDGSYVRVTSTSPTAAIPSSVPNGARAVWMDSAGKPTHSAVVSYPLTGETRRLFISKWDNGSLMRHAPGNSKYDSGASRIDYFVLNTSPDTSPPPPSNPSIPANGIVRTPEGTIWVLAGGAKYAMSWTEYVAVGSPRYTDVPASLIAGYGTLPRTNTFLRNPVNGSIFQVLGGAKYGLSLTEYQSLGTPAYVNVPQGFIDRVSGTVPQGPLFLRNPVNGSIFQVLAGAKYGLSMTEYQSLGTPAYVNVPQGFIDRVSGTVPQGPLFLRNPVNGAIFQVVGGAKYKLSSLEEWQALGSPGYANVPQGFIDRATAVAPQGTWFLRDSSQTIYQVVGGAKFALSYPEWAALGYPGYVAVPNGFTARITATVPTGTVYLRDDAGSIFRVAGGTKSYLSYDAWAALGFPSYVQVPTRWLNGIPATTS